MCPFYLLRNTIAFKKLSVNESFFFELSFLTCHCHNFVILEELHESNGLKIVVQQRVGSDIKNAK